MKNPLLNVYEKMLLSEAEKNKLQNPSSDEVGKLKSNSDLFGSKPKPVEGPEKAKMTKGPAYKETTGSSSAPKGSDSSMPKSSPAKNPKIEKGEEMEDAEVNSTKDSSEEEDEKNKPKKESFTMNAFETLFKKTLMSEEVDEFSTEDSPVASDDADLDLDVESMQDEDSEEDHEEEEENLISDLRDLQDKLASILDKLEALEEEEEEEEEYSEEYSEDDFDDEFGNEENSSEENSSEEKPENSFKESLDKPKPLNPSKGKSLQHKKNKVGKLSSKKGKAHTGSLKYEPSPKALGDKKSSLQKGNSVKSSVKKGEFIK